MPFRDADRRVTRKDALRRAGDARRFKPAYERRPPACRAGNLVDDGQMRYSYDPWNRLVKVTRKQDTNIVIQTAEYDGLGRRVSKAVTKSGDLDGTFVYYYADTGRAAGFSPREFSGGGGLAGIGGASPGGWSIVEIRDGSNNVYQQVYHGTQYIDEIVAMRLEHGYAVVYQAEADQGGRAKDWNTIATCDLAGRVLERVFTTPYGSPIIEPETYFGDYDGDGDVDATDDGFLGSGQTCWGTPTGACRVFDFNSDGTLNSSDETIMTALVSAATTNRRHENRTVSPIRIVFLHQGLVLDRASHVVDNRMRLLLPVLQRFVQLDPDQYSDGLSLYTAFKSNPLTLVDPSGKTAIPGETITIPLGGCGGGGGFRYSRNCDGWNLPSGDTVREKACKSCAIEKVPAGFRECVKNRLRCNGHGSGPVVTILCDSSCTGCGKYKNDALACGNCPEQGSNVYPVVILCEQQKSDCDYIATIVHEMAHNCGWECPMHTPGYHDFADDFEVQCRRSCAND